MNAKIPEDIPIFNQLAYGIKPGTEVKIVGTEGKKKSWILKPIIAKQLPKKSKLEVGELPFATLPECPHLKTGVPTEMAFRYILLVVEAHLQCKTKSAAWRCDCKNRIEKLATFRNCDESRKITLNQKKPVPKIVHFERNQLNYSP